MLDAVSGPVSRSATPRSSNPTLMPTYPYP